MTKWCLLAVLAVIGGCTRHNEKFCCLTPEDCAAAGQEADHVDCAEGLACVERVCIVPTCSVEGCPPTAPVCDTRTDVCAGCSDSRECARFAPKDVCDQVIGSCVECLSATDCSASAPVCDQQACRGCRADSECPSLACDDDGTCVPESEVVYLSSTGSDAPPCDKAAPCRELVFGVAQANPSRTHIVFAPGTYVQTLMAIGSGSTTAPSLAIHGGGATLIGTSDDGLLFISLPGSLRDLEAINTNGFALRVTSTFLVERVKLRAQSSTGAFPALMVSGTVTARDITIQGDGCGVTLGGGTLTLDRATISGTNKGICAPLPSIVDISNVMISDTLDVALDLPAVTGTIAFTTIANTGATGTGPTAVSCTSSNLRISSSIVWTPNLGTRAEVEGACVVTGSIVGPNPLAANQNVDPLFVAPQAKNYRLSNGSPARDATNAGPTRDFEGDLRPRGSRFDLGADEAP